MYAIAIIGVLVGWYLRPKKEEARVSEPEVRPRRAKRRQRSRFEVYQDKGGEYRFRLKAPNGEIIAVSEGYTTKRSCMRGIESVKRNAQIAGTQDLSEEALQHHRSTTGFEGKHEHILSIRWTAR